MKLERDNSVSRSLQLSTLAIPREAPDVLGMKSTSPPASPALSPFLPPYLPTLARVYTHWRVRARLLFMFVFSFILLGITFSDLVVWFES